MITRVKRQVKRTSHLQRKVILRGLRRVQLRRMLSFWNLLLTFQFFKRFLTLKYISSKQFYFLQSTKDNRSSSKCADKWFNNKISSFSQHFMISCCCRLDNRKLAFDWRSVKKTRYHSFLSPKENQSFNRVIYSSQIRDTSWPISCLFPAFFLKQT